MKYVLVGEHRDAHASTFREWFWVHTVGVPVLVVVLRRRCLALHDAPRSASASFSSLGPRGHASNASRGCCGVTSPLRYHRALPPDNGALKTVARHNRVADHPASGTLVGPAA